MSNEDIAETFHDTVLSLVDRLTDTSCQLAMAEARIRELEANVSVKSDYPKPLPLAVDWHEVIRLAKVEPNAAFADKIHKIKVIRSIFNTGLKEAKDFVEAFWP